MKKPLIIVAGPTASGKTSISISLAKKIGGEVISADSMQVYRGMDIGTAKPSLEEMQGVKHHLIDCCSPFDEFNVTIFQEMAKKAMKDIWDNGKIPIVTGGTGFYINALLYDNNFTSTDNDFSYRQELYALADKDGPEALYKQLQQIDPEYAAGVHSNNIKRVSRALEYFHLTGQKFSVHNNIEKQKDSPYHTATILLTMDRQKLYERINLRVEKMMEAGLLREVENLLNAGCHKELVSMQGLGYKEFLPYFAGDISLHETVENLKQGTRRYAKRQLTWFRSQARGLWVDRTTGTEQEALVEIMKYLKQKGIIGEKND